MVAWPLIATVGVLAAFAAPPSFADAASRFEAVAQELRERPGVGSLDRQRIGLFEVASVVESPNGEVYFADARTTMLSSESGWAYSPSGPPTGIGQRFRADHVGGPWYRYQSSF